MTSPLLALFIRSVREDCRGKGNYLLRGMLLVITLLFVFTSHFSGYSGAPGLEFFRLILNLNCVFITLAGLSHFASAVTEEKEEMTLGLLRMTSLNPLSILLGKSVSRMLAAVLLLLVQFPFTLLAVSLGGVSLGQVYAAYCTLAAYIWLLGCVALFFSVLCRRTTGSAAMTLLFLLFFFFAPVFYYGLVATFTFLTVLQSSYSALDVVFDGLSNASPFTALEEILQTGFSAPPVGFQAIADLLGGVAFFALAWAGFNRFTRHEADASPSRALVVKRTSIFRTFGAGRASRAALVWKDFYFMSGGKLGWIIKFILLGLIALYIAWMFYIDGGNDRLANFGGILAIIMSLMLVLELTVAAARMFRSEMQWQTFSSIATLPMTTRQLAYQKFLSALLAAAPTLFFVLGGFVLAMTGRNTHFDHEAFLGIAAWACEALFLIHLTAYLSLLMKRAALPVAFGLTVVANMLGMMVVGPLLRQSDFDGTMLVIIITILIPTGFLHAIILDRLPRSAAEDA